MTTARNRKQRARVGTPNLGGISFTKLNQFFFNNWGKMAWNKFEAGSGSADFWGNQTTGAEGGTSSEVAPTGTEAAYHNLASTTTAGAIAGIGQNALGSFVAAGAFDRYQCKFKAVTITGARYWIGIFGVNTPVSSAALTSDGPALQLIAFRYSDGLDHTWQCFVRRAAGVLVGNADTGIAPDSTHSHIFEIRATPAGYNFFIDFVKVASIAASGLSTSQQMTYCNRVDNKGAAISVSIGVFYQMDLGGV